MFEADPMSEIVTAVANGKCILFLGAAVHREPPDGSSYNYPEANRPPVGPTFSQHLAAISNFAKDMPKEDNQNLQRVSQYFQLAEKRSKLVSEIKAAVDTNKKPSPVVRALAQLNFPLVVTTNYDQLFETAVRKEDKKPYVSIYQKDPKVETVDVNDDPSEMRPFIFKMHGDIDVPESIVMTDEDYIHFVLRMTNIGLYDPIPKTFQEKFRKWPTLFIGYSLKDYNL